ncbi:MAG TPA: hypothetical protein VN883_15970 [Myxococcales bacterium]|jgi:hypothetical protein|nr:hypothetical protein [Myxococcales bacterium]
MGEKKTKARRNPLLGAAVLRALLDQRASENRAQAQALYDGVLRDLGLTDAAVQAYLEEHVAEVEDAIRSHGRRG